MDVTPATLKTIISMGGSGSPRYNYLSANRSLNFASDSNSLTTAATQRITALPFRTEYKDTVGLFGSENYFIRVDLDIQNQAGSGNIVLFGYLPAAIDNSYSGDGLDTYDDPVIDYDRDLEIVNTYLPAVIDNSIGNQGFRPLLSIALNNIGTGNKFIDSWLDCRLYTSDRKEHPYDLLYISPDDHFYIGVHARNTKRLPYDIELLVGQIVVSALSLPPEEERFVYP